MNSCSYDPSKDIRFRRFVQELEKESDRGIAIICHAYVEDLLKTLLKKRLIDDKKFRESLEERISFSHVLAFCFLTGIVTEAEKKDIEFLSSVRNHFAHHREARSFSNKYVIDKCKKLRIANPAFERYKARKRFIQTAAYYIQIFNLKLKYVRRIRRIERESRGLHALDSLYI